MVRVHVTQEAELCSIATVGDIGSTQKVMKKEKVSILNSQGLKLVGELEDTGSKDLCVLCHGFQSSKELPTFVSVSKALTESGFSTYRFDFTGNGESNGEFAYGNYWREAEDIRSVVNYWRYRGWRGISLIGHSKGGNAVLLYASKYKDVASIVNISGRFDLRRGIKGRLGGSKGVQKLKEDGVLDVYDRNGNFEFRVLKSDLDERLATDMHKACLAIPEHCSVLNVHGSADEIVPAEDVHEFGKRIRNNVVHVIDGADHNYKLQQQEIARLVADFVRSIPRPPLRASL